MVNRKADGLRLDCFERADMTFFVEQGQESRDKFMSSGQNVAIKGATVGYYLFRRCEANKRATNNPWEDEEVIALEA